MLESTGTMAGVLAFSPKIFAVRVWIFATSPSVCRTFRPSFTMRSAACCWSFSVARPRITLAWPTESRPSRTKPWKLLRQLRIADRLFDGVQVFALQIFDERQLQHRAVVGLADDDGDFRQVQKLRRAPAAFAGDEFKETAAFAHNERLHDALFADGIGQFLQRLGGKFLARLERGRADPGQRHALDAFAVVRRGRRHGGRCSDGNGRNRRRLRERRMAAQQRAETTSQCRFCHLRRVSQQGVKVNFSPVRRRACAAVQAGLVWRGSVHCQL